MTATLKNVPIKATATSKMREEKAKAGTVVPAKQPMKAFRHQGIPIILHNQKQSEAAALEAAKAKRPKPVSANSVHIKLYEKDKEIRAKLESERQKEIERERQMALFKASDAKVLSKRPFMPRQCDKDPVRPRELNLRTDLRSEERQKFDQAIKEKEAEMEAAKQQVWPLLKHAIQKVKFLSTNSILTKNTTFSRVFRPIFFLTIFLVKSKLSTAKKPKSTTFSRVFHPNFFFDNFSREIKVVNS